MPENVDMYPRMSFVERYNEVKSLGYQDWECAKIMGITVRSLVTQMRRRHMKPDKLAMEMSHEAQEKCREARSK